MAELVPTLLAGVAVGLVLFALWAMAADRLAVGGAAFLSASLVIYLRETWATGDA